MTELAVVAGQAATKQSLGTGRSLAVAGAAAVTTEQLLTGRAEALFMVQAAAAAGGQGQLSSQTPVALGVNTQSGEAVLLEDLVHLVLLERLETLTHLVVAMEAAVAAALRALALAEWVVQVERLEVVAAEAEQAILEQAGLVAWVELVKFESGVGRCVKPL